MYSYKNQTSKPPSGFYSSSNQSTQLGTQANKKQTPTSINIQKKDDISSLQKNAKQKENFLVTTQSSKSQVKDKSDFGSIGINKMQNISQLQQNKIGSQASNGQITPNSYQNSKNSLGSKMSIGSVTGGTNSTAATQNYLQTSSMLSQSTKLQNKPLFNDSLSNQQQNLTSSIGKYEGFKMTKNYRPDESQSSSIQDQIRNQNKEEQKQQSSYSNQTLFKQGSTFQPYQFGDNYGNARNFQKPSENTYEEKKEETDSYKSKYQINEISSVGTGSGYGYSQVGLNNIGNTCFMNSILQCIFATAPLTKYFLKDFSNEKQLRSQQISESYSQLLKNSRNSKGGSITPSDLKQKISRVAPQFMGYGQQDAQEFLRFLLDGMHNELNRVVHKLKYKEINCDNLPIDQQSNQWADYFKERDNSIITDLFEGQLCSKIECQKCNQKSYTFDNFMDLSISIPRKAVKFTGYVDINECIQSFIAKEVMESCGYKCSKCKAVDNMEKEMTIFRFPKILVIHLKRFYNSTMRREKLSTTVNIPTTLDMRQYAPYSNHASKQKAGSYKLYGMSHHSGTLNGGHYIGEVLDLDQGNWFLCNDSRCSKQSSPDTNSASAYVLFYIQQN